MQSIILFFAFFLASCAQQNEIVLENTEFSTSFIKKGDSKLDIRWWHSFNNEELMQLVAQGLQENLSLKAYDLTLKSSAIDAKIAGADLYPTLNLNATTSSKFDDVGDINSASLGLSSSWELDLWGGIAANENRAYWNHQGQLALYRGRANLVAGSITNAWLGLVSEQEKKLVLANQFKRTNDALKVISRRFALGKNSITNIWQQHKLLKSIEVQQSKNLADLFIYQQTLALWLGVQTSDLKTKQQHELPSLPKVPGLGVPAQVLKYRPDIELAFTKIKAAGSDDDIYSALGQLYQYDEVLKENLEKGLEVKGLVETETSKNKKLSGKFIELTKACAKLMVGDKGLDCAMLELGGWDTHNNQSNRLNQKLGELDNGLAELKSGLGDEWKNTVVIIGTEFGRTVKENGTGGTDHGTGSALILAGGAVNGGRVQGRWPGLKDDEFFAQRDLMPTSNCFGWIGNVLSQHWQFNEKELKQVFPQLKAYNEAVVRS